MTEELLPAYADPLTAVFWDAAAGGRLLVQRCRACGHHQLYPRPWCVVCYAVDVEWVKAGGSGTLYSKTTMHVSVRPELEPPYTVGLVELDEGPRVLALDAATAGIGERVLVEWRQRGDEPPILVYVTPEPVT
jgi:uncharacterized OB-fold protein